MFLSVKYFLQTKKKIEHSNFSSKTFRSICDISSAQIKMYRADVFDFGVVYVMKNTSKVWRSVRWIGLIEVASLDLRNSIYWYKEFSKIVESVIKDNVISLLRILQFDTFVAAGEFNYKSQLQWNCDESLST